MTRMHNPPHPGEVLREYLGNTTVTEAAIRLGVNRVTLSRVVTGSSGISADMAYRLAVAFDTSPELWAGNAIAIRPVPGQQARAPTHPEDGGLNRFSRSASKDSIDPFATEDFCASIHHLATFGLASKARTASIYTTKKFSDNAPLTIGYDFNL